MLPETVVTAAERATYAEVWDALWDRYGATEASPGVKYLPLFLDAIGAEASDREQPSRGTVLDAGCGSGVSAIALAEAGFEPILCDLTDEGLRPEAKAFPFAQACLWKPLRPAIRRGLVDYVYCCDVLEHLPTQFVGLAIEQMLRVADRGLFISVSLVPDKAGVWLGKTLHQTVQGYQWWKDTCAELGTVVDARDLISDATFLVRR